MYPEDVTFGVLISESIAVLDSNLGFPGCCVSPNPRIDPYIDLPYSTDASQCNMPIDFELLANLSNDVFPADEFSVPFKGH